MTQPTIALTKYHGLGNDFCVLANVKLADSLTSEQRGELARLVCDRNRGVGADGLLFVLSPSPGFDTKMRLHNYDGSIAEMSGNGIRCFTQAAVDAKIVEPGTIAVETDAGLRTVIAAASDQGGLAGFRVDMGTPKFDSLTVEPFPQVDIEVLQSIVVDVGNPHLVILVSESDFARVDIGELGPKFEQPYLLGPTKGINVEICSVASRGNINMKVWERGVGVTQACGTGSTAAALAIHRWELVDTRCEVNQPGGAVSVEMETGSTVLIGASQYICSVEFPFEDKQ